MATFEDVNVTLYDSVICRLCATENVEGIFLYDSENESDFKALINRYLPIQVEDDGKSPRTICPGCNIQLESTIQFFDLLVEGQRKIRELWKIQTATRKKLEKEKQFLVETLEGNPSISLVTGVDETIQEDDILIRILPDGNFFGGDHEMTLKIQGLERPKRKRGRPKKVKPDMDLQPQIQVLEDAKEDTQEQKEMEEESYVDESGRKRRRRKVPQRFMEAVQGKELDRILREEGAIDGNESDDSVTDKDQLMEAEVGLLKDVGSEGLEDTEAGEVIGHLETPDGNIAEQIIAPSTGRGQHKRRKASRFVCDFCSLTFKDRTRWIRHRLSHKGMKFQCTQEMCLKRFSSKNKLKLHQKTTGHEGEDLVESVLEDSRAKRLLKPRLACKHCSKTFASLNVLSKHLVTEHPEFAEEEAAGLPEPEGAGLAAGEEPPAPEAEADEAKKARVRSGKLHACDECGRTFNHPSSLMYHKESVHNDGRRFVCSKCNKSFTHKQLLQRHQMVHSDTRPFPCPDCGLRFKTKSNLFNHRVVHTGEKKFSCQLCGQQFAHKTSLTLHLRWHKGYRPFKCHVCQKCFTQNGNLREHIRIHTNTKPYGCEFCGKFFTTSSQHKLHVKRHTGDRPWKCSHCDRSFLHKDTWRTHERRHTGEKPYQCSYCMRGFAEHWSLKKHVRLHTGEKPYKCLFCGKEFADCSNLTKHRKVHLGSSGVGGAGPKVDNTVWSIIQQHLLEDVQQQPAEDVQQIIYVTYQEGEEGKTVHLVDGAPDQELKFDDENKMVSLAIAEAAQVEPEPRPAGSHLGVTDEEGNAVQMTINGRTVDLVSMDTEANMIHVRTADGQELLVPLSKDQEITEEDLALRIQQAVVEELRPRQSKSILLPKVQREPGPETVIGHVLTGDMLTGAEIIEDEEQLGEHKRLVTEFEMDDTYKKLNEFLATQQC